MLPRIYSPQKLTKEHASIPGIQSTIAPNPATPIAFHCQIQYDGFNAAQAQFDCFRLPLFKSIHSSLCSTI